MTLLGSSTVVIQGQEQTILAVGDGTNVRPDLAYTLK